MPLISEDLTSMNITDRDGENSQQRRNSQWRRKKKSEILLLHLAIILAEIQC